MRAHVSEGRGVGQRACASAADRVAIAAVAFCDPSAGFDFGVRPESRRCSVGHRRRGDEKCETGKGGSHAFSLDQVDAPNRATAKVLKPEITRMR